MKKYLLILTISFSPISVFAFDYIDAMWNPTNPYYYILGGGSKSLQITSDTGQQGSIPPVGYRESYPKREVSSPQVGLINFFMFLTLFIGLYHIILKKL